MNAARVAIAAVFLGGAVGAVWASRDTDAPDGLIGWPAEQGEVAAEDGAVGRTHPGECGRARDRARDAWSVMATATRRWAAEVKAARDALPPEERANAEAILAADAAVGNAMITIPGRKNDRLARARELRDALPPSDAVGLVGDAQRADDVVAAVDACARDPFAVQFFALDLEGTSLTVETYADALALSAKATEACRIVEH